MERPAQNKALREWAELEKLVAALGPVLPGIMYRGSYDSGRRRSDSDDPVDGTVDTGYSDPTGEIAVRSLVRDRVEGHVEAVAYHIHTALNIAKNILDITPQDVIERAKRDVPDCLACGKPVPGAVKSGYCLACYSQWQREGYPDRHVFEQKRSRINSVVRGTDWRIDRIDVLQERGELPAPRGKSEST